MTPSVDDLFVDTNILIYATDSHSPWHQLARMALANAVAQNIELIISPQIINEYLSAATRYALSGGPPLPQLLAAIAAFRARFRLIEENDVVISALLSLVQTIPMAEKQIHDANIVATMQAHGIHRLLTNNPAHFARFAGLITIVSLV